MNCELDKLINLHKNRFFINRFVRNHFVINATLWNIKRRVITKRLTLTFSLVISVVFTLNTRWICTDTLSQFICKRLESLPVHTPTPASKWFTRLKKLWTSIYIECMMYQHQLTADLVNLDSLSTLSSRFTEKFAAVPREFLDEVQKTKISVVSVKLCIKVFAAKSVGNFSLKSRTGLITTQHTIEITERVISAIKNSPVTRIIVDTLMSIIRRSETFIAIIQVVKNHLVKKEL